MRVRLAFIPPSWDLPTADVPHAIRDCWVSMWEERVLQYLLRVEGESSCPAMAVVIQPMVHAVAAGVAYSIHPVTGRTSQVFINAVPGLASALVGGEVVPDQYMVEMDEELCRPMRIRRRQLARKQQKLMTTSHGVRAEPIPEAAQQQASIADGQLYELAQLSKQVEQAFGHPIDLEWAWDAQRLWVLQARPITGVRPLSTLTDDECEWTRANLKETMPDLPSPLGLSFLKRFMDAYIIGPYRRLGCTVPDGLSSVRVLHGRPYLNVTLFYTLVSQLHGNPAFLTEQMGGSP
jgi:phosphoenolpyruvate synthase/pyruvate phosphate dikinase